MKMLNWLISLRIRRLKVQRAGLLSEIKAHQESGMVSPRAYKLLGEVEEKLKQLEG